MSTYLPTPADDQGSITPIESQGRYAVATFELFQASTDALDDLGRGRKQVGDPFEESEFADVSKRNHGLSDPSRMRHASGISPIRSEAIIPRSVRERSEPPRMRDA